MNSLLVVTLLLATSAAGEQDDAISASVIDNRTDRVPVHTVVPEYPRKQRRDRIEGEVQVCFEIDRKGRPRRAAVRHSTHRAFEKPSLRAVRASSFLPLKEGESPSGIKSCRTFVFALKPVYG